MGDAVDPADLARLRSRAGWTKDGAVDADRASECAAERGGHRGVVMEPGDVPRCEHCGASLSPDALRRAGIKGRRSK